MILRYQNRKLYNKTTHKYITVGDVLNYFKADNTTRVYSHKTGVDVTSQVIIEALKKKNISLDELSKLNYV